VCGVTVTGRDSKEPIVLKVRTASMDALHVLREIFFSG